MISKHVPHFKKLQYANNQICGMHVNSAPIHFEIIFSLTAGLGAGDCPTVGLCKAFAALLRSTGHSHGGCGRSSVHAVISNCVILVAASHTHCDFPSEFHHVYPQFISVLNT